MGGGGVIGGEGLRGWVSVAIFALPRVVAHPYARTMRTYHGQRAGGAFTLGWGACSYQLWRCSYRRSTEPLQTTRPFGAVGLWCWP